MAALFRMEDAVIDCQSKADRQLVHLLLTWLVNGIGCGVHPQGYLLVSTVLAAGEAFPRHA